MSSRPYRDRRVLRRRDFKTRPFYHLSVFRTRTERIMSIAHALVATRRLGLGPRPGEIKAILNDPKGYVAATLNDSSAGNLLVQGLGRTEAVVARAMSDIEAKRSRRRMARAAMEEGQRGGNDAASGAMNSTPADKSPMARHGIEAGASEPENFVHAEVEARVQHASRTTAAFVERLVMFWSNHFCVSTRKSGLVRSIAGVYERDAIRPHVLGRFVDMVKATAQHPAMLQYLDNAQSVGPNSHMGARRNKGLNENYARELLELHTLGVDGGYEQTDVEGLARILTGWTTRLPREESPGTFMFNPASHEPGSHTVLGRAYADDGVRQGLSAIEDIARHPSTARHIAKRLSKHFVSDNPPPAMVDRLERCFRDTDGDLKEVSLALVSSDEVWSEPPRKILPPYDLMIATYRALNLTAPLPFTLATLKVFGQRVWGVDSPKGWNDDDEHWAAPKAMMERIDWAQGLADRFGSNRDVADLADDIFGGSLSSYTREAIVRSANQSGALVILLLSPEFQRR